MLKHAYDKISMRRNFFAANLFYGKFPTAKFHYGEIS